MPHRHTNRRPFTNDPVPAETLEMLARAAAAEGATLMVADKPLRDGVLSLTRTADNRMRTDPHYRAELAAWTTPPGIGRRDGVPRQAFGPRATDAAIPMRDFAVGHGAPVTTVQFEVDPTIVLLRTNGDGRTDWLRAGIALEHVLLAATAVGLSATPLTQVVAVPALRGLLTDAPTGAVVQSVLRLGYAATPVPPTPRRPLDEMVLARKGR
jgi:nitroreductase